MNYKKEDFTITASQLVKRFGVTKMSISNWVKLGVFPHMDDGISGRKKKFHISCMEMTLKDVVANRKKRAFKSSMGTLPHVPKKDKNVAVMDKLDEILRLLKGAQK